MISSPAYQQLLLRSKIYRTRSERPGAGSSIAARIITAHLRELEAAAVQDDLEDLDRTYVIPATVEEPRPRLMTFAECLALVRRALKGE